MTAFALSAPLALPRRAMLPPRLRRDSPAKRVRMRTSDRWPEFSVGPPSDDASSPSRARSTSPVDWPSWRRDGHPMRVPAIPFPPQEVFLPGETKQLHLFEARYLSLFEHVVINCDKQCAHVLVAMERKAMAAYGTVVRVREWRRLNVGVSVSFEAVGRLRMTRLHQASPFLQADVQVVHDEQLKDQAKLARVASLEEAFWPLFRDVVALCIQLGEDPLRNKIDTSAETIAAVEGEKASRDEMEDVRGISKDSRVKHYEEALLAAAKRAVNEEEVRFFIVTNSLEMLSRRATALSFAAWDFFASTPGERQKALEQKDTEKRLEAVVEQLELRKKKLAAKIALQNAFSE